MLRKFIIPAIVVAGLCIAEQSHACWKFPVARGAFAIAKAPVKIGRNVHQNREAVRRVRACRRSR